jgi:hypothetical protein
LKKGGTFQRLLSRWVRSGWLHQLRRGLYALAPPYRKVSPHPFEVANRMPGGVEDPRGKPSLTPHSTPA